MSSRFNSGRAPTPEQWPWPAAQPIAPIYTPEQIVSLLMQRLQPALDELHARLDKIEHRLPLTDDERKRLEAVRATIGGAK